jgi:hypothetical protein
MGRRRTESEPEDLPVQTWVTPGIIHSFRVKSMECKVQALQAVYISNHFIFEGSFINLASTNTE